MGIICLKLRSGEELIGSESDKPNHYRDVASVMMVPGQGQNGQVGLGLFPFLSYSEEDEFEIKEQDVMIKHRPSIEMINNYNRIFGSGIQIAKTI